MLKVFFLKGEVRVKEMLEMVELFVLRWLVVEVLIYWKYRGKVRRDDKFRLWLICV